MAENHVGAAPSRRPAGGSSGAQQPVILTKTNGSRPTTGTIYTVPPVQISTVQPTGYYFNYKTPANPIAHVQAARQQSTMAQNQHPPVLLYASGYPDGAATQSTRGLTLGQLLQLRVGDGMLCTPQPPTGASVPISSVQTGPTEAATRQSKPQTQNSRASPPMTQGELLEVKSLPPTHTTTPTPPKTPPPAQILAPPPPPNTPQPGKLSKRAAIYQATASGITPSELESMRTGSSPLKRFLPGLRKHIPPTIKAYPGLKEVTLYDFEREQVVLEAFKNERHYARGHYCFRAIHDIKTAKTSITTISLSRFTTPRSSPQIQGALNTPEPSESGNPVDATNSAEDTKQIDLTFEQDFAPPTRKNTASSLTAATEKLTCQTPTPPPTISSDERIIATLTSSPQPRTPTPSADKPDQMDLDHPSPPTSPLSSSYKSEPEPEPEPNSDSDLTNIRPDPEMVGPLPVKCRFPGLGARRGPGTRGAQSRDMMELEQHRKRKMASQWTGRNRVRATRKSRGFQDST